MRRAKATSLSVSPGWKRMFSSSMTGADGLSIASAASSVSIRATSVPKAVVRAGTTWARLISGFTLPLGRPKWAIIIGVPPRARMSLMVGTIRSIRVVSVTWPFSTGTLISTRTNTRLPLTFMSSRVFHAISLAPDLSDLAVFCRSSASRQCTCLAFALIPPK